MQTLIQDLLAYSRTNTAEKNFELCDLNDLLHEVLNHELKEKIEEKNAVVESSTLPTLSVIPFQFRQLMTNILSNSLKFSKPNIEPHIIIQHKRIKGDKIAGGNPKKHYSHISVTDNGIGFEPEYNLKIFEVFQRLHGRSEYTGTGIGLAICKKIVENHAGIILAEGDPGSGAVFHIYLPE